MSCVTNPPQQVGALKVNQVLLDTVNRDVLSGSGVDAATFWASVERSLDTQRIVPFKPPMLRSRQRSRVQTTAV